MVQKTFKIDQNSYIKKANSLQNFFTEGADPGGPEGVNTSILMETGILEHL